MSALTWRTDHPAPNRLVEVWFFNHIEFATWDGDAWHSLSGALLVGVTHWRERTRDQVHA